MLQAISFGISALFSLYSFVVLLRVVLSWIGGVYLGRPYEYLCKISDPYLNWFRRFRLFRTANIDLSPVLAIAVLSTVSSIAIRFADTGRITIGFLLSLAMLFVWSIISCVLFFYIIVLVLRFIGYCVNANVYTAFWRIIDFCTRPLIFRVSRIFFRNKIIHYQAAMVLSIVLLIVLYITLNFLFGMARESLEGMPIHR